MAHTLAHVTVTRTAADSFMIAIDDDAGTTTEFEATYDQLDQIVEAIDEQMSVDADDDLVDDEEAETDDD